MYDTISHLGWGIAERESCMESPSIVVVGSSNTDLVVRVPHIPLAGETLLGGAMQRNAGGKGANQAVAARRLGAEVWFIGCMGQDDFGDEAAKQLASEGLRLDHVTRIPHAPSGIALIAVADSGENAIIVAPGANAHVSVADLDRAVETIAAAQMVIAQLEIPLAAVRHAFSLARTAGVPTLLNAAPAQSLSDDMMALVDVLVCNETEAEMLTGQRVMDATGATIAARALRDRGPPVVIVTLGANGCLLLGDDAPQHIPAFAMPVVDTTAAGDAFIGALAVQMTSGVELASATRYACACAALAVGRLGAQPSLPTVAEVALFLEHAAGQI